MTMHTMTRTGLLTSAMLFAALTLTACAPEDEPGGGDADQDVGTDEDASVGEDAGGGDGADSGEAPDASDPAEVGEDASGMTPGDLPTTVGTDERPANIFFPPDYDGEPLPLVFLLHGYTATGATQDAYFGLRRLVPAKRFIFVLPDGTRDGANNQHWNATDACCAFLNKSIDDSGYLRGIIDEVSDAFDVTGVFFMGHSNGGFMSYRMACEHSDVVDGVLSLAGATFNDPTDCAPQNPVRIIQVHGTADTTILYDGGEIASNPYPSAEVTASTWADYNGCDADGVEGEPLDLMPAPGAETIRKVWGGCDEGGRAELWSIPMGSHIPSFGRGFGATFYDELVGE